MLKVDYWYVETVKNNIQNIEHFKSFEEANAFWNKETESHNYNLPTLDVIHLGCCYNNDHFQNLF